MTSPIVTLTECWHCRSDDLAQPSPGVVECRGILERSRTVEALKNIGRAGYRIPFAPPVDEIPLAQGCAEVYRLSAKTYRCPDCGPYRPWLDRKGMGACRCRDDDGLPRLWACGDPPSTDQRTAHQTPADWARLCGIPEPIVLQLQGGRLCPVVAHSATGQAVTHWQRDPSKWLLWLCAEDGTEAACLWLYERCRTATTIPGRYVLAGDLLRLVRTSGAYDEVKAARHLVLDQLGHDADSRGSLGGLIRQLLDHRRTHSLPTVCVTSAVTSFEAFSRVAHDPATRRQVVAMLGPARWGEVNVADPTVEAPA